MPNFNIWTLPAGTQLINAVTTPSRSVTFSPGKLQQVQIYNAGSGTAFIEFGTGSATATIPTNDNITSVGGSMPIPSGAIVVFDFNNYNTIAAITASGTATVYCTLVQGRG